MRPSAQIGGGSSIADNGLGPRVILINGEDPGGYVVQYGVGVTVAQVLRVSQVDEDVFDA